MQVKSPRSLITRAGAHTSAVVSYSSTRAQHTAQQTLVNDSIIMITILLPLLFRVAVSDQASERHPYSYTYNVLDVPSNNNYEVT